ncbi:DNA adenine methylase [[Clostridium] colinum]|uniref:DNA adenine methylase n=1 Tax=[Clostridium] colinum TaxID=36835 RepID=UPI00202522ED|nr:DNA adenine methylase [[Clostridium] colinum]
MKSFISWIGGKNNLKKEIVSRFPEKYSNYIEVFGGAGWVLFHKEKGGKEIYNDLNSELVNLFKVVKYHPEEFIKECEFLCNSKELLDEYKENYTRKNLTDIQRASNFYMLIKYSYGSDLKTYGSRTTDKLNSLNYIRKINERLSKVVIENLDFERCIKKYDKEETLFYLDPPYFNTEAYYKNVDFKTEDHKRLRDVLKNIKGKFLLSYNDCEEIRELYKDFNIEEIERHNNLMARYKNKDKNYRELIIKNY